jgi:L,D-transpeptidase catalytic domain
MDGIRGWFGVFVAVLLVTCAGVGWLVLDSGSDSDAVPSPAPPPAEPPFKAEAEADAPQPTPERPSGGRDREPRPAVPAEWRGGGYKMVGIEPGAPLPVRRSPGGEMVRRLGARTEFDSPRVLWVAERRGPWLGVVAPELGNNRVGWLRLDRQRLRFGTTRYSMQVDLSERLVELRQGDRVVRRVIVSVGRIGSGTPAGRFSVTDVITRGLSDSYGCCAIALSARQPNTPPGWIGGDRIAVHGWNGPVGDAASGGCLRANNADMERLVQRVPVGTPVFIDA